MWHSGEQTLKGGDKPLLKAPCWRPFEILPWWCVLYLHMEVSQGTKDTKCSSTNHLWSPSFPLGTRLYWATVDKFLLVLQATAQRHQWSQCWELGAPVLWGAPKNGIWVAGCFVRGTMCWNHQQAWSTVFRIPPTSISRPSTKSLYRLYAHIFLRNPFMPLLRHLGNGRWN